jgi:hypothetical protein
LESIDIRYLAGFFDGEGCFYLGTQLKNGKEYPKAQILLSQSGPDGLDLLKQIQCEYGGHLYHHLKIGQHKATKDAYKLWWNKQEGVTLIKLLLPHLRLKQHEAQNVLNYLTRK